MAVSYNIILSTRLRSTYKLVLIKKNKYKNLRMANIMINDTLDIVIKDTRMMSMLLKTMCIYIYIYIYIYMYIYSHIYTYIP
jgi:hypothetical protein